MRHCHCNSRGSKGEYIGIYPVDSAIQRFNNRGLVRVKCLNQPRANTINPDLWIRRNPEHYLLSSRASFKVCQNSGNSSITKGFRAFFFSDNKVLIVIGGDSNYKNEEEEARSVISRWAKKKVASQFGEEYLDGRQSFIFSWDEKHRPIHEEAMQHFLDPDKRGFKFECTPPRPLPKHTPPVVHHQPLPKPEATELPQPAATRPGQQVGNVSFLSSFVVLQNRCPWNYREQRPTV